MLDRLIREYLDASEKDRAEFSEAAEKVASLEDEAALIMKRAAARAKKKTDQAERIREELRKKESVSWMDGVIKPLAEALAKETGLRSKVSGPCGICCQVYITLCEDPTRSFLGQDHKTITLQPDFSEDGLVFRYETGEVTERFAKGTVGAMNGMNNVTEILPSSLDEILKLMRDVPSLRKAVGLEPERGVFE